MEALHRLGIANPARNFIIASQGALDEDGIPVVVLAKRTPFTPAEEAALLRISKLFGNRTAVSAVRTWTQSVFRSDRQQ